MVTECTGSFSPWPPALSYHFLYWFSDTRWTLGAYAVHRVDRKIFDVKNPSNFLQVSELKGPSVGFCVYQSCPHETQDYVARGGVGDSEKQCSLLCWLFGQLNILCLGKRKTREGNLHSQTCLKHSPQQKCKKQLWTQCYLKGLEAVSKEGNMTLASFSIHGVTSKQ